MATKGNIMNKKVVKLLSLTLSIVFVFSCMSSPVFASKKTDLKNLEKKIDENQNKLNNKQSEAGSIETQIENYDTKIAKLENSISEKESEKKKIEDKLEKTKKELKRAKEERKENQDKLKERLEVMYMYGDIGYMELLFSSDNFSELVSRMTTVQSLVGYDQKIIAKLQKIEKKINEKKKTIEEENAKLKKVLANLDSEKKEIATLRDEKTEKLKVANKDIATLRKKIAQDEADAEDIRQKLMSNATGGNYSNGGRLGWPTPGYYYITSEYGHRSSPGGIGSTYHRGMDIGAPYGAKLVAPGNGKVTIAYWYGGYGNAVGIDLGKINGKNVSVMMAHNSSISVGVGQRVTKGQQVGRIGSTGNSTGPHCHIEVHVNGNAVNPRPWLF